MTRLLLPHHQKLLEASGISPEVAHARGYWSATKKKELQDLGFSRPQQRVPALVVPVHNARGEVALHQIRPDEPRCNKDGKPIKYETPKGAQMTIDVPPAARGSVGDPSKPLFITEGGKKADSAVSRELCCIDLLGVWNWRGKNGMGGLTALPDWESIALKGREVFIAFDSDVMTKPEVHGALARLKAFLESRGAKVKVIYLPPGPDGTKVGLDDYFVAGGTVDNLLLLATSDLRKPASGQTRESPYTIIDGGLYFIKDTQFGAVTSPLTNFVPKIIADVIEDDGAEERRAFDIEVAMDGRTVRVRVPAAEFNGMSWVPEHLGCQAVIYAGAGAKDHARVATQILSGKPAVRRVYLHTGWRNLERAWIYLHAGGAIGADGVVPGVEVRLDGPLARFVLPAPPIGADLVSAVCASLRLLDLADARIVVPVVAAVWRAPLGPCDVTLHLVGPTGQFKTECAALGQRHFGPAMDADHLPGSWLSTGNALEGMAHQAKDAVFVVDDFVPAQAAEAPRLHREAERLLRAKGNSQGRQRMKADTTLRPPKPPRALLISTGEDTPRGQSLRARMFIIEVPPGAIEPKKLSVCQADAAAGHFASAMAGFVKWLAPKMDGIGQRLMAEVTALREKLDAAGMHRRTPETTANLALGLTYFFDFAVEIGAISKDERAARERTAFAGLRAAAEDQQEHHESNDPARRFSELLRGVITSGAAHVADPHGHAPNHAERWGWFRRGDESALVAQGGRVGWIDGEDLYLDADAAFSAVQKLGRDSGEVLAISLGTLKRRLKEKGWLASTDIRGGKERFEVRRQLQGDRRTVLHVRAASMFFRDEAPEVAPDSVEKDLSRDGVTPGTTAPTVQPRDPQEEEL